MATQPRVIDLDDAIDRRRYRCPKGHTRWEPTNNHFYCGSCGRRGLDAAFTHLIDHKTREEIPRSEVKLTSEAGDYENWRVIGE